MIDTKYKEDIISFKFLLDITCIAKKKLFLTLKKNDEIQSMTSTWLKWFRLKQKNKNLLPNEKRKKLNISDFSFNGKKN